MEAMEDDSSVFKDDPNHNYCASGSGKVQPYLSSQLSDETSVPQQPVCSSTGGEPGARLGRWSGGSKFMDSDTGSDSSEVSEGDCAAQPAAAEGTFSLDSTSKFRKFTLNGP